MNETTLNDTNEKKTLTEGGDIRRNEHDQSANVFPNSVLVGELARMIQKKGVDIGQKKLFQWLRENHYLYAIGDWKNLPTQKSYQLGLFVVKSTPIIHKNNRFSIAKTVRVTRKGQAYLINEILDKLTTVG